MQSCLKRQGNQETKVGDSETDSLSYISINEDENKINEFGWFTQMKANKLENIGIAWGEEEP